MFKLTKLVVVAQSSIRRIGPRKVVALGYLSYFVFGWILLSLPGMHTKEVSSLDDWFTAASAVSTTGLATLSVSTDYTPLGHGVILLLIQVGGLGYMTMSSFAVLTRSDSLPNWRREIAKTAYGIPSQFQIKEFLKAVIVFSLVAEVLGTLGLWWTFEKAGIPSAFWQALFHSISAYCTAGFSIFGSGFQAMHDNVAANVIVGLLSYLGAIGFIVWTDLALNLSGKRKTLTFTSKIIFRLSFSLLFLGTLFVFVAEPTIADLPPYERLMKAAFQVMTSSTTVGFNTIDFGSMSNAVLWLVLFFMMFGASPSGTGGGMKITTLSTLWAVARSTVKGRDSIRLWKRELPRELIEKSASTFVYFFAALGLSVLVLLLTESQPLFPLLFEAVSALGTVGTSMGVTGDLSVLGKLVIILLMFMGRVGVLTFGIVTASHDESRAEEEDNEVVLG